MHRIFLILTVAAAAVCGNTAGAQESAGSTPVRWYTGTQLARQMQMPVTVNWSGAKLRPALSRLAEVQRVAMMLDRRIDPGQSIDLSLAGATLEQGLEQIAEGRRLAVARVGPVVYFGPAQTTQHLRTLLAIRDEKVNALAADGRSRFNREQPLRWDALTTPRELLERLSAEAGIEIVNLEQLPHDLWPAGDLPPTTLVERLTLILAGFHLTFQIAPDGRRIAIMPIREPVEVVRTYPISARAAANLERLKSLADGARLSVSGDRLEVRGRVEAHKAIKAALAGRTATVPRPPTASGGKQVYTLKIAEQPIGPVLRQLAKQLKVDLRFDEAAIEQAGISLDRRVSFEVRNASLEELLQAATAAAGLKFQKQGSAVLVGPE